MVQRRPPHGDPAPGEKIKWIARYYDAAGDQHSKSFDRQKDAKSFEDDQALKVRAGTWVDPQDAATPLSAIAEEWLSEAIKPNTIANRKALVDNLGPLGRTPVGRIKASNIVAWRNTLIEGRPWKDGKPLSESTVGNMVGQVCGLLNRAHEDGMIGRIPQVRIPKAAPQRAVSRQDLLTVEEVRALIAAARDGKKIPGTAGAPPRPEIARMLEVAVGSGLRVSELAGMRVCDVDTLRRTITVNGQAAPGGREWVAVPKSQKSHRTIPVPESTIQVIAEQLSRHPQPDRQSAVFPYRGTVKGRQWHDRESLGRVMRKLVETQGLRKCTWHDLRHLYASALIAAGSPPSEVQEAMGHAKASTTLDLYTHLWPKADERVRAAASGFLNLVRDGQGIQGRGRRREPHG